MGALSDASNRAERVYSGVRHANAGNAGSDRRDVAGVADVRDVAGGVGSGLARVEGRFDSERASYPMTVPLVCVKRGRLPQKQSGRAG